METNINMHNQLWLKCYATNNTAMDEQWAVFCMPIASDTFKLYCVCSVYPEEEAYDSYKNTSLSQICL